MNFTAINALLAAQTTTQPNPTGEMIKMVGMMAIMVFAFYFAIIRPQQKRTKEHDKLLKSIKTGDKVLTAGGVVGTVLSVREKTVSVRSADTKLEILKSAVTEITERGTESKES
jgi:preprotein translocase subunit YajC